jgi:hypothetical protein
MDSNRFDELTRSIAQGTSRRHALKVIAGSLLAAFVPHSALAKGGNSDCAHFCNSAFPPGPQRGKCTSDAAKGKGVCYECGPKSNGTKHLCGTTCIGSTEPCNGTCPGGSKLCNGTCIPNDQCCTTEPNPLSNYQVTCYNSRLTCDSDKTTLSADCEDVFGEPLPTSIVVNTCSSSNYVIVNCNAVLTCGSC